MKLRAMVMIAALLAAVSIVALAQSEPALPPPPPGPPGANVFFSAQGPGGGFGGAFFHEDVGLGNKVVTGAPMTATVTVTHDQTLADGNTIHTDQQSTEYRDSQGRVRREVPFKLVTPSTGATQGTMVIISDPVAGKRYVLNPQNKTAHEMPLHPPAPPAGASGEQPITVGPGTEAAGMKLDQNVSTESLGSKSILGLPAQGTRVTRTIPAGQIGNAKPILVVTERWTSTDLQIPLMTEHSDPMMGTMTMTVTSVNRGEPDASLFQVPSDYKVETGRGPGDAIFMHARP